MPRSCTADAALLLLLLLLAAAAAACCSASLPPRAAVLADGMHAADYWFNRSGSTPGCGWENATLMIGVSDLQAATGDAALLRRMAAFGEAHGWALCGGAARALNPDFQACGATYVAAYAAAAPPRNASWLAAAARQYAAETASGAGSRRPSHWSWIDAVFMAVQVYARLGSVTGDQRYFDFMHQNFEYAVGPGGYKLWSPNDSLFYRDPAWVDPPSHVFWGRGNGWALGALATAHEYSPPGDPHRAVYADMLRRHAARLAGLQGADGCWRSSLTQPAFNPAPEATGTAMFAAGMAYGVRAGLLDAGAFMPVVERAWGCLTGVALQPDGRVGFCQPGGDRPNPNNVQKHGSSSFCQGQFLMAAAAVAQLAR